MEGQAWEMGVPSKPGIVATEKTATTGGKRSEESHVRGKKKGRSLKSASAKKCPECLE